MSRGLQWILASASPRRRELLARLVPDFRVVFPEVEEWMPAEADPVHQVEENARRKGRAVAERFPQAVVLAADTTVALGRRLFGKPADLQAAAAMLRELSGRVHTVSTAVALFHPEGTRLFHETSEVTFRTLDEGLIAVYLQQVAFQDKAGGYAIQEHGDWLIERYTGSFENIMGLPVQRLQRELVQTGWGSFGAPAEHA